MKTARLASILLGLLTVGLAQTYKCDWSVVGIGGGDMTGTAYKCGATASQTATGFLAGPQYWAMIGFWQTDTAMQGIHEQAQSPNQGPLVTRLYAPQPNPFRIDATIRYSLSAETWANVQVHDLTGRVVRTLADGVQKPGRYSLRWDGRDNGGRRLGYGVYFCRLVSGEYAATRKMVKSE